MEVKLSYGVKCQDFIKATPHKATVFGNVKCVGCDKSNQMLLVTYTRLADVIASVVKGLCF